MASIIAGLGAQLGLDTTEFRKGIHEAKESISELKENLIKLAEVTAFVELTKKAMEFSNTIVTTAKANDVAVSSILELSAALEENGGSAENTGQIYSGFTQKIELAAQGNAKAQESFARLGVSLNDLRHLSEQDLFDKTVTSLSKMADAAERNGLAVQVLGKGIRGVDIRGLASGLEEGKGAMDKYAESVEQAHELSLKLDKTMKDFTLNFTSAVIPSLLKFYEEMGKDNDLMKIFNEAMRYSAETAVILAGRVVFTFKAIGMEIGHTIDNIKAWWKGGLAAATEETKKYEEEVEAMSKRIADFEASVLGTNKQEEHTEHVKKTADAHREVTASYAKQLEQVKALLLKYQDEADLSLLVLKNKEQTSNMTKKEKEVQDEINKVLEVNVKKVDEITTKIATIDTTSQAGKDLKKEMEKQRSLIQMQVDFYVDQTRKTVEENQKLRESFTYGWDQAFREYADQASTAADFGRQSFNSVISSMDSALTNFVKTGKLSFSDLARTIIQNLLSIQLTMQANSLMSSLFKGMSLSSLVGGSVGASTGTDYSLTSGQSTGGLGLKASAVGGPLGSGEASIVGENGPELFIPKGAGTVIPNSGNLSGANLGSTTVNNYNIHAIDTQSFEQRLYQSSGAIWAANQYATKNIATNRSRT